jgi:hypothetical protein
MTEITIREGGRIVWDKNQFVEGTAGISTARLDHGRVTFEVGSGHYAFQLTGQ